MLELWLGSVHLLVFVKRYSNLKAACSHWHNTFSFCEHLESALSSSSLQFHTNRFISHGCLWCVQRKEIMCIFFYKKNKEIQMFFLDLVIKPDCDREQKRVLPDKLISWLTVETTILTFDMWNSHQQTVTVGLVNILWCEQHAETKMNTVLSQHLVFIYLK